DCLQAMPLTEIGVAAWVVVGVEVCVGVAEGVCDGDVTVVVVDGGVTGGVPAVPLCERGISTAPAVPPIATAPITTAAAAWTFICHLFREPPWRRVRVCHPYDAGPAEKVGVSGQLVQQLADLDPTTGVERHFLAYVATGL